MYQNYKNKLFFGIVSGIGTRIIGIFTGLITTPMFFRYLPKDVLGVWMFFLGTEIVVNLTDLGFSPVLQRHIAFELGKGDKSGTSNYRGASYFLSIARWTGLYTSLILFLLLGVGGGLFLLTLGLDSTLLKQSLVGCIIFAFGKALLARFKYFETALNGHGEVGWQNWIFSGSVLFALAGYYIILRFFDGSLIALTTVSVLQSVAIIIGNCLAYTKRIGREYRGTCDVGWKDASPYLRPALDMFVVSLGAFLILNTDQYFIIKFLGPASLPDYAATYRLLVVFYSTSTTLSAMTVPFVARRSASGDHENLKKLVVANTSVGMVIFLSGIIMFAFFGDRIVKLWLGPGHFVGWPIVWVFCMMLTLENHHVIFAQIGLNCKNDPTWGKVSIISGLLNLTLTYIGVRTAGLLGVASATMISQLCTNNWYAVRKTLLAVGMELKEYLHTSVRFWGAFLIVTAGLLGGIKGCGFSDTTTLSLSIGVVISSFAAFILMLVRQYRTA